MLTSLLAYLKGLVRRDAIDTEVDEELGFHVEMETQANIDRGMKPTEARRVALRDLGGITQTREATREVRRLRLLDTLSRDVRYALRSGRRNPAFTIVAVLTLALAIGANTAVFALIDQLLLRPLPVKEPDTLVLVSAAHLPRFGHVGSVGGRNRRPDGRWVESISYELFSALAERVPAFAESFAQCSRRMPVLVGDTPNELEGQLVSGNYFRMLGIKAAAGRLLSRDDDRPGASPVAVISHGYWQRQFAGDPSAIGRTMRISGHPVTIIGVAAAGFTGLGGWGPSYDFFAPLELFDVLKDPRMLPLRSGGTSVLEMIARLRPGTSIEQAQAAGETVYQQLWADAVEGHEKEMEEGYRYLSRVLSPKRAREIFDGRHLTLFPAGYGLSSQSFVSPQLLRALQMLMVMAVLLLLIAASNVTNLIVARGAAARREVAICLALGASRTRLLAERLVDNLLVAAAAGAGSLLVAEWLADVLLIILPLGSGQNAVTTTPDRRTMLFTFGVALATGLFVWLASSLQVTRRSTLPPLTDTGLGGVSTRPLRLRRGLLALQTALSLALLCAASMFAHSLFNLTSIDAGFQVTGLTTFTLQPSAAAASKPIEPVVRDTMAALAGTAGVQSVAATTELPLMNRGGTNVVGGNVPLNAEKAVTAGYVSLTPGYFRTIGLPLVRGREFTEQDTAGAERVAVVNESLARALFGDRNPIGERIGGQYVALDTTVVGVVKDTKASLRQPPEPAMFTPLAQHAVPWMTVVLRTKSGRPLDMPTVRALVNRIDSTVPVTDLGTMEQRIADTLSRDRILALLSSAFAGLAALLCGLGLFGMMNFHVATRQRELGIRLALGAERRSIQWTVVREAVFVILAGAPVGLAAYLASSRVVGSFLFDLSPTDVPTVAGAACMLVVVALAASFVPARRATHLDPAVILRRE
jgi:predicted permease